MSSKILKRQLKHLSSNESAGKDQSQIEGSRGRNKQSKRPRNEVRKGSQAPQSYKERVDYYRGALKSTQASKKAALAMQKVIFVQAKVVPFASLLVDTPLDG